MGLPCFQMTFAHIPAAEVVVPGVTVPRLISSTIPFSYWYSDVAYLSTASSASTLLDPRGASSNGKSAWGT